MLLELSVPRWQVTAAAAAVCQQSDSCSVLSGPGPLLPP